jgi:hypothetical protein
MELSKIEQYKMDIAKYQNAVSKLRDVRKKQHYENLLESFKKQTNLIDDGHSSYFPGKIEPKILRDNIKTLSSLRYELNKLL